MQSHDSKSTIVVETENNRINFQSKYNLDVMVNAITQKNLHHVKLEDGQFGAEEW